MPKVVVLNYTFDASAKTIAFTDYSPVSLDNILIITNVTDNIIIYNFADAAKGGTAATNILTLGFDTTTMDDTDHLQIWYWDKDAPQVIKDGGNVISVDDAGASITVDGTIAATQSGTWNVNNISGTVSLPTGAATAAKQDTQITSLANLDTALSTRLKPADTLTAVTSITNVVHVDDNSGSLTVDGTLGISGNVTVVQPTGSNLHTVLDSGTLSTITNVVHVDDNSGSITVDGTVSLTGAVPSGSNVIGHVIADTGSTTAVTGNVTVVQTTGSNLHAVIDSGTITTVTNVVHVDDNSATLSIDDGAGSITVDGTVAATQSGTWNVATVSTVTNVVHVDDNSSTLSVDDGGGSITVDGSLTVSGTVDTELTTSDLDTGAGTDTRAVVGLVLAASGGGLLVGTANPLPISDNSGSITVDNGGTFAVQVSSALPAGSAVIGHVIADSGSTTAVTGNVTVIQGTGSNLHTVIDSGTVSTITNVVHVDDNAGSLTVDGSVTANAGTNLNTSLLALEAGGNLAGTATSLAIMDDWDESDRAKVNPIAGQAGVQGASGVVTALTQRMVLATDVALPAGTNVIGHVIADTGSTTAVTGNVTVIQGTGSNLHAVVDSGTITTVTNVVHIDDNSSTISVDDGAGSLTVDGSVTVTQATGSNLHAVIDSGTITTVTNVVHVDDNSGTLSVDDGAGSITVDNAGTFAVQSTLQAGSALIGKVGIDQTTPGTTNKVSLGSDVVHIITDSGTTVVTQPTGTNLHTVVDSGTITSVTQNPDIRQATASNLNATVVGTGTFVTQSSITSIVPGTGATNLGKAEDSVFTDGDTGVFALGVRQDTPLTDTSTSGDYSGIKTDSQGRLWINSDILSTMMTQQNEQLTKMLIELRIMNTILKEGLNTHDQIEALRNDESYTVNNLTAV